jgi:hypothetical protein
MAAILTAVTGLIVGLHQAGLLHVGESGPATPPTAVASERSSVGIGPPAGEAGAKPQPAVLPASAPGPNLLAVDQGGKLVAAPSEDWAVANDGDLTNSRLVLSRMGAVFGFKDDKPATFNRFGYLVLQAGDTPASIEIAGSDKSSGPFHVVATVRLQDAKIIATDGWQYFELPQTTARYVRITLGDSTRGAQGGNLTELGLFRQSGAG